MVNWSDSHLLKKDECVKQLYKIFCGLFVNTLCASMLIVDEVPIVHSTALKSPAAQGHVRLITVYMPAIAFQDSTLRFPVVYYLPGLGGDNMSFTIGNQQIMDTLIAQKQAIPMIIVHVDPSLVNGIDTDGKRRYEGTWYVNSELNGGFADFMVRDLIPFVDAHYPTLANAGFRAVMGQSMGGFGSVYHGILHPELYSAFAQASGTPFFLIATDTVIAAPDQPAPGKEMFVLNSLVIPEIPESGENEGQITPDNGPLTFSIFSYSGAFSPNVNFPPYFVDLPFEVDAQNRPIFVEGPYFIHDPATGERIDTGKSLIPRPEVIERWKSFDPYFLLEDHIETLKTQFIYHDGGDQELINVVGARMIAEKMAFNGVESEYILYEGNHVTCLTTELCARHRTMLQMMSARFIKSFFPPSPFSVIAGTGSIILQGDARIEIHDKANVSIETDSQEGIMASDITIEILDSASFAIGDDTFPGGVFQIGNRVTKADQVANPSLLQDVIKAAIIINGVGARFDLGHKGMLGIGAGIDAKDEDILNFSSITTLEQVNSFTLKGIRGFLNAQEIATGADNVGSLILIGKGVPFSSEFNPPDFEMKGGSNLIFASDSLHRHPVILNEAGEQEAGGVRSDLDPNPDAIDYFFQLPIGSQFMYKNNIHTGLLSSLEERDDAFVQGENPFVLDNASFKEAYEFLAIDERDGYENPTLTSKEASVAVVDDVVFLTYVDEGKIIRLPESLIPIGQNQTIDLRAIAENDGVVLIRVETMNNNRVLIRVDPPA
jgi:hypothetical protein